MNCRRLVLRVPWLEGRFARGKKRVRKYFSLEFLLISRTLYPYEFLSITTATVITVTTSANAAAATALWGKTRSFWDIESFTFPRAREWVSKRTKEWAQRSKRAKRAVSSKQMSVRCEKTSKRTSEWPSGSTYIPILGSSEPQSSEDLFHLMLPYVLYYYLLLSSLTSRGREGIHGKKRGLFHERSLVTTAAWIQMTWKWTKYSMAISFCFSFYYKQFLFDDDIINNQQQQQQQK